MRKNHKYYFVTIILDLIIFGSGYGTLQKVIKRDENTLGKMLKIQPPLDGVELELLYSFPTKEQEEKDQYLWDPYDMEFDSAGNIYITEGKKNVIRLYDPSGKYIMEFGRSGQGPGDLSMPFQFIILKDTVIVKESANRRLQYFDLKGNSKKIVKLFKTYQSFDINDNGLFFGIPLIFVYNSVPNSTRLVEVLSSEGMVINSFGDILDYKFDYQQLNMAFLFIDKKGDLILIFEYFPIVRRFSQNGTLINEYHIESEMFAEKEKYNKRLYSYRPSERVAYIQVVHCAKLFDDHLFIVDFVPPRIWIREISEIGNLIKTYWARVGEHYLPIDILLKKEGNRMVFYILQRAPEAKVNIFVPKNK